VPVVQRDAVHPPGELRLRVATRAAPVAGGLLALSRIRYLQAGCWTVRIALYARNVGDPSGLQAVPLSVLLTMIPPPDVDYLTLSAELQTLAMQERMSEVAFCRHTTGVAERCDGLCRCLWSR
jgi:hypothetical protein